MTSINYLVPHDFSKVGDVALNYAIFLSTKSNASITLIHLVSSKDKIAAAASKLDQIVAANETTGVKIEWTINIGNIFDDLGKIAQKMDSTLIIMGTHGISGMQKIFGSYAMKVVRSTSVPFVVVQDKTSIHQIKNIVAPVDLSRESLQIITYVAEVANMFDAEVFIVYEAQTDPILATQMRNRLGIVLKEFEERKVKINFEILNGSGSFHKKILEFGKTKNADLYAAAFHTESLLPQFEKLYQTLITNDQNTPCIIVNAKESTNLYF